VAVAEHVEERADSQVEWTEPDVAQTARSFSGFTVADAVRAAMAQLDREAYLRQPERVDDVWDEVEAWGEP
jgi:putative heme iron utilization protein